MACVLGGFGSGCAGALQLQLIAAAARPPGHVALLFSADDARGQPVVDLTGRDIQIFEDGELISAAASGQALFDTSEVVAQYTLLLLDLNANVIASEQLRAVVAGLRELLQSLAEHQHVAVFAFDGGKALYEIVPFSVASSEQAADLRKLSEGTAHDPATNLHGAVLLGLSELQRALSLGRASRRIGNLVVVSDGFDRANRIPYRQMLDAVDATSMRVFTIGVGRELNDSVLSRIGKTGYIRVEESAAFRAAYRELASQLRGSARRYYLLSYCSPARGGEHVVELKAHSRGRLGSLAARFDATGFGSSCDASTAPALSTTAPADMLPKRLAPTTASGE